MAWGVEHTDLLGEFPAFWIGALLLTCSGIWLWSTLALRLKHCRKLGRIEQLCLVSVAVILAIYLLLRVKMEYHYMMVLAIPLMMLAAKGTLQIPRRIRWIVPFCCGLLLLGITFTIQSRVIRHHGDPREFGPSGNFLEQAAADLDRTGIVWNIRIVPLNDRAGKKLDPIAGLVIFDRHMAEGGKPGLLVVDYTDTDGFQYRIAGVK